MDSIVAYSTHAADFCNTIPLKADIHQLGLHVRKVPITDNSRYQTKLGQCDPFASRDKPENPQLGFGACASRVLARFTWAAVFTGGQRRSRLHQSNVNLVAAGERVVSVRGLLRQHDAR